MSSTSTPNLLTFHGRAEDFVPPLWVEPGVVYLTPADARALNVGSQAGAGDPVAVSLMRAGERLADGAPPLSARQVDLIVQVLRMRGGAQVEVVRAA